MLLTNLVTLIQEWVKSRLVWVEPYGAQLLAENKAHANAALHAAQCFVLFLSSPSSVYVHFIPE